MISSPPASRARGVSAALLIALLAVPCARSRAQDSVSAPYREPSPKTEEAAAPTPAPAATPQREAQPKAEAKPTPAATVKPRDTPEEKPEAKRETKPAAAPKAKTPTRNEDEPDTRAAVRDSDGSLTGVKLRNLEERWEKSIADHDTSVIEKIVANDFVGTGSTGRLGTKSTLLHEAKRDKNSYDKLVARNLEVHLYGSTVAVITGVAKEVGRDANDRKFEHSYRFTDTWMERGGNWQCIASHAMIIPKK